jgi:hypothetical protein
MDGGVVVVVVVGGGGGIEITVPLLPVLPVLAVSPVAPVMPVELAADPAPVVSPALFPVALEQAVAAMGNVASTITRVTNRHFAMSRKGYECPLQS